MFDENKIKELLKTKYNASEEQIDAFMKELKGEVVEEVVETIAEKIEEFDNDLDFDDVED